MVGTLLIATGILSLILVFRRFIRKFISWAEEKIYDRSRDIVEAVLYLIKKGQRILSILKTRKTGRYKWKEKEYDEEIDIDDIPEEIKEKLMKGKKVKIKEYS
jgi:hypothetical protein